MNISSMVPRENSNNFKPVETSSNIAMHVLILISRSKEGRQRRYWADSPERALRLVHSIVERCCFLSLSYIRRVAGIIERYPTLLFLLENDLSNFNKTLVET